MNFQDYRPNSKRKESPLPQNLKQQEITRNHLTSYTQIPCTAESIQMTMNSQLMSGSSITSNKPLTVFAEFDLKIQQKTM